MIRSPTAALATRAFETGAVTILFVLALVLPCATYIFGSRLGAHLDQWLQSYEPIVYLAPEAPAGSAEALRDEVAQWSGVQEARVRTPEQALASMRTRLGAESVERLGMSEAMMPTSVIISPTVPLHGHIELSARASALEARAQVVASDVASADALRLLEAARGLVAVALILVALMVSAAAVLIWALLRRIRADEEDELELLEVFGASRHDLTKPTIARGFVLGLWSGLGASVALCVMHILVSRWLFALTGVVADAVWTWGVVLTPALLGPVIGACLGRLAARPHHPQELDEVPDITGLLTFGGRRRHAGA